MRVGWVAQRESQRRLVRELALRPLKNKDCSSFHFIGREDVRRYNQLSRTAAVKVGDRSIHQCSRNLKASPGARHEWSRPGGEMPKELRIPQFINFIVTNFPCYSTVTLTLLDSNKLHKVIIVQVEHTIHVDNL